MRTNTSNLRSVQSVPVATLLRALVFDAFETVIGEIGEEEAYIRFKPHAEHSAMAIVLNLRNARIIADNDPNPAQRSCEMLFHMGCGKTLKDYGKIDTTIICRISHCAICGDDCSRTAAVRKAYCRFSCDFNPNVFYSKLDPSFEFHNIRSKVDGWDECIHAIVPRGTAIPDPSQLHDQFAFPTMDYEDSVLAYLPVAYMLETWAIFIHVLSESIGDERVSTLLAARMRDRGRTYRINSVREEKEDFLIRAMKDLLFDCHINDDANGNKDVKVDSCLLVASPPICCHLLEELLNGMTDVHGDHRKLDHISMIPMGDTKCAMKIHMRKVSTSAMEANREALGILQLRLARGEISPEEFAHLRQLMSE